MDRGYLLIATGKQYVKQAYLCAKSIKETQTLNNVSIATADDIPDEYKSVFDHVIELPWISKAESNSMFLTEQRWKSYHITPYEETVVLDADMVFIDDVSHWWDYMKEHSVLLTTNVKTFKNTPITSDYYRKAFTANHLPNVYCAYHYFKKDDVALDYYQTLEHICKNQKEYYKVYVPKHKPDRGSMDINHAIAVLHTGLKHYTLDTLCFTHMKSHLQSFVEPSESWIDDVPFYANNLDIKIGNYRQTGILHYTDNQFCEELLDDKAIR